MMNVVDGSGARIVEPKSDYFKTFIRAMLDFFHDPAEAVPHAETLKIMAITAMRLNSVV